MLYFTPLKYTKYQSKIYDLTLDITINLVPIDILCTLAAMKYNI